MSYAESLQWEVEQIGGALRHIDSALPADPVGTVDPSLQNLRDHLRKSLISITTNLRFLEDLNQADLFGQDPTLAVRRYKVIEALETTRVDLQFTLLPRLETWTRGVIQERQARGSEQQPELAYRAAVGTDSATAPANAGGFFASALKTAEGFLGAASNTVGLVEKTMLLAKAVGVLFGVPLPI